MSKFLKEVNRAYKGILIEQTPMPDMNPMGAGAAAPAPAVAPMPPVGAGGAAPQEQPVETPATRSSSDAFLIGMVAKALLIDVDDDDKLKIVKYLKGLDEDSASAVEENLVNIVNSYDYQNLEGSTDDYFKVPPKCSRKVLKFLRDVMEDYIDTETAETK